MEDKYILGINFLHSDTSSCIFRNGKLIAAAEDERFSRIKHTSSFPVKSINFCLQEANIDISQLDIITVNSNPFSSIDKKIFFYTKKFKKIFISFKKYIKY